MIDILLTIFAFLGNIQYFFIVANTFVLIFIYFRKTSKMLTLLTVEHSLYESGDGPCAWAFQKSKSTKWHSCSKIVCSLSLLTAVTATN